MRTQKGITQLLWAALLFSLAGLLVLSPVLGYRFQGALAPLLGLPTPLPSTPIPYGAAVITQSALMLALHSDGTPAPTRTAPATASMPPLPTTASPTTAASVPAGMVPVPAGAFVMGSTAGRRNERPEHPVLLDAFLIDQFEVTNAAYRACVSASACMPPQQAASASRANYSEDPAFDAYPVIWVDWVQAGTYCQWAGKRLPTEAEWEYAAGGPDHFQWPWGTVFAAEQAAVDEADTVPVERYPTGASPFGAMNMAGNVAEWVADTYDPAFYAASPAHNPLSVVENPQRIYRGGSFGNPDPLAYTTSRRFLKPIAYADVAVGFRCARPLATSAPGASALADAALVERFCLDYRLYRPGGACP